MKTINDRIRTVAKYYGITSFAKFAKRTGLSHQTASNYLKGKQKPDIDKLSKIKQSFDDIDANWLLTGEGYMLRAKKTALKSSNDNGIPLILSEAFAGFGGGEVSIMEHDIQDRYIIPDFSDVDFMIRIKGSSMYPKYASGDVVACRMITNSKFIQWNKVHVLSTRTQGVVIKRLKKCDNGAACLLAVSDNAKYDPFEIPMDEIINIALVVGVVRLE